MAVGFYRGLQVSATHPLLGQANLYWSLAKGKFGSAPHQLKLAPYPAC